MFIYGDVSQANHIQYLCVHRCNHCMHLDPIGTCVAGKTNRAVGEISLLFSG